MSVESNQVSTAQQRAHFERVSEKYFQARKHPNHLLFKHRLWKYFFSRNILPKTSDIKVLEPMCGYSEGKSILEDILCQGFQYTGFDYSTILVDHAQAAFPDANIFLQDITQFDSDEEYDIIILIGGLHHVYHHMDVVMSRLFRALKPGGYFINFEPTQNNWFYKKIRNKIYKKNDLFDDETEQAFDLKELNTHYQHSGFELVDQVSPGLLAYILYYNPDAFPKLNIGPGLLVNTIFNLEKLLYANQIGQFFSFATLSLLKKP